MLDEMMRQDYEQAMEREAEKEKEKEVERIQYRDKLHNQLEEQVMTYTICVHKSNIIYFNLKYIHMYLITY